jgi:hypothetical protein
MNVNNGGLFLNYPNYPILYKLNVCEGVVKEWGVLTQYDGGGVVALCGGSMGEVVGVLGN